MHDAVTFQVHANVNADHGDSALRLTITCYDAGGHEISTQTYRKHVRTLDFDSPVWQAYNSAVELARMMAHYANSDLPDDVAELDVPLF